MTASTSHRTANLPQLTAASAPRAIAWEVWAEADLTANDLGFRDIDDVVADVESTEHGRSEMAAARSWLAETMPAADIGGLAAMRLRRGLSQRALAEKIGTSQPHIARLENGQEDILLGTAQRLAEALNESLDNIASAFPGAAR
jgi:DNA-binding XRE family transcriptional regulator